MAFLDPPRTLAASALALLALGSAPAFAQDAPLSLLGGGSSFAAPVHMAWIEAYRAVAPTVDITYESIGSG